MTKFRFLGDVTLGNMLLWIPLLGLLATASLTLYRVGNFVQSFQDALVHEIENRTNAIVALSGKIDEVKAQQLRDNNDMKSSIQAVQNEVRQSVTGVRDDIRALLRPTR